MFSQAKDAAGRSEGGLGSGLALVKGLVELHGGRAEARSGGAGRGSASWAVPNKGPGERARPRRTQQLSIAENRLPGKF